ncbi:LytR/AlgR family response regulator transcription factor [Siphonobacter sp.]|uniref:LytR/AlgR family response regulator transcription factor n=1 Tax=Siphonobacter sp. TaxID=1869184 RepID=UPI003B3AD6F1
MNVLILEDEPKAAYELKHTLETLKSDLHVCAILPSIEEARTWLSTHDVPDLIFADIILSDGKVFHLFKEIEVKSPVIFCTAYDEFALEAFEANGIDYLLKPIEEEKLQRSLEKIERLKTVFSHQSFLEDMSRPKNIFVHFRDKLIPIEPATINYIYTYNHVAYIHTDSQQYEIRETLDELALLLPERDFYRANRQYIIPQRKVQHVERSFTRKLTVKLTVPTPQPIVVSKARASEFLQWLKS